MRTIEQMHSNAKHIYHLMNELKAQISIIESEYMINHSDNDYFNELLVKLSDGWSALNTLAHMEAEVEEDEE